MNMKYIFVKTSNAGHLGTLALTMNTQLMQNEGLRLSLGDLVCPAGVVKLHEYSGPQDVKNLNRVMIQSLAARELKRVQLSLLAKRKHSFGHACIYISNNLHL